LTSSKYARVEADVSEVADCKAAKASAGEVACRLGGAGRTAGKGLGLGLGGGAGAGEIVAEMPSDALDNEEGAMLLEVT
jgi:hypothetical protein